MPVTDGGEDMKIVSKDFGRVVNCRYIADICNPKVKA